MISFIKYLLGLNFKKSEDKHRLSNSIELLTLLISIVLINLIVLSFEWQLDLTKDKIYSLNPITTNYVTNLSTAVDILFLCNNEALSNQEIGQIDLVLKLIASQNKLINYKIVDPNMEPAIVNQFNKDGQNNLKMGTLIIKSGNISKILDYLNLISYSFNESKTPKAQSLNVENAVLSALQFVQKGQHFKAYNILGHGEVSFEEITKMGERSFFNALDDYNYRIEGLTLSGKTIPSDTKILFILSPKTDLDLSEKSEITRYLENGGSLFISLELTEKPLPVLYSLMNDYGIAAQRSLVTEYDKSKLWIEANSNPIFFAVEFPSNPINQAIINKNGAIFVGATLQLEQATPLLRNITITPLMQSSNKAKIIPVTINGATGNPVEKQATVAMLAQKKNNEKSTSSLVVTTGRTDIMQKFDGPYWFSSLLSYLNNDKNYLQVENKSLVELPIRYKSVVIVFILAIIFVIIVPSLLIIMSIITYLRRKNL